MGVHVDGDGIREICNGVKASADDELLVVSSRYVPLMLPMNTRPGASVINAISPGCNISLPLPG